MRKCLEKRIHISSNKIFSILNYEAEHTIDDAIKDLLLVFEEKKLNDPINNINYYNIKLMQSINLV